jgi:ubiquinone/menaquinone biosynthesis C-methylase UbiE
MSPSDPPAKRRDFWWNADFIALMARRWQLDAVHGALDVGAGAGHWGRLLVPHLAPEARVFGIDREDTWIREARRRAESAGLAGRLSYRLGDAERIPFHDGTFDLVTCQRLILHAPDPLAALREMMRVLKPRGRIVVAELDTQRLGEGHDPTGDVLLGWFAEAGLDGVAIDASNEAGGRRQYLVSGRKAG